jgi:hypothetical protein
MNNKNEFIPTNTVFKNSKTIAGKNSDKELRDRFRLEKIYGGKAEDWDKRVGKIEPDRFVFDMHWYELNGRQYEMKLKHRGEKK